VSGAAGAGELDPEARDLIAAFEASSPPSPDSVTVDELRQGAHDALRIAIEPPHPTVAKDVTVPRPNGADIPARRYQPAEDGATGLLVYFHGGGFVRGDLDTHDPLCRALAGAAGCTVVSVAYRRAPEHPFPAAVDDAVAATAWATGGSAGPVAVGGDSSGGNLAAVAALATDRLAAQLLLYPVTDATMSAPSLDELAEGRMLTRAAMEWYYHQYLPDRAQRTDPRASPLLAADHAGLAPAIVVTAGQDPVRDDGERYAAKLQAAGTPVTHLRYPGTVHSFMLYAGALATGREAIEAVAARLRAIFHEGGNPALK
jgi:acetyl esterase